MNAELIEKGKFYYNYLIKTTSGMYDLLSDEFKTEIYENKKEMYLVDINVAIQATLLKMSYIDGEFNEKELEYIDSITEGNYKLETFLGEYLTESGLNLFNLKMLMDLSYSLIDNVFGIVDTFLEAAKSRFLYAFNIVNMCTRKNYEKIMLDCMYSISSYLSVIDEETDEYEKRRIEEIIKDNFILEQGITVEDNKIEMKSDDSYKVSGINQDSDHLVFYGIDINKAIVYIETNSSSGTGFFINNSGVILTCYHVIQNATKINVIVATKEGKKSYQASVKKYSENDDYALLEVDYKDSYYLALETNYENIKHNEICIVGYPYGKSITDDINCLELSLTRGFVSSKQIMNNKEMYFLDANAFHGNSGGPVFDVSSKKVIGILIGAINPSDKMVYMYDLQKVLK